MGDYYATTIIGVKIKIDDLMLSTTNYDLSCSCGKNSSTFKYCPMCGCKNKDKVSYIKELQCDDTVDGILTIDGTGYPVISYNNNAYIYVYYAQVSQGDEINIDPYNNEIDKLNQLTNDLQKINLRGISGIFTILTVS